MRDLPCLLRAQAMQRPDAPGMLEKHKGVWRTWSWREIHDQVRRLAAGLAEAGLRRGEHVALLNGGSPALAMALLGVQAAGGVPVLLRKADLGAAPLQPLGIDRVIAERALDLATLAGTIGETWSQRWLAGGPEGGYAGLAATSDGAAPTLPTPIDPAEVACVTMQADPTGELRPLATAQAEVVAQAQRLADELGLPLGARVLSGMPLAWVPGLTLGLGQALVAGGCLAFAENVATVPRDMREIGPAVFALPTAGLRALRRSVYLRAASAGGWRNRLLSAALEPARNGSALVSAGLRDHLGFTRRTILLAVGAEPAPALRSFFSRLGVALRVVPTAAFFPSQDGVDTDAEAARVRAALEGSLYIRHAMTLRRGDGALVALLGLDDHAVGVWAQRQRIVFDQSLPLSAQRAVIELIARETRDLAVEVAIAEPELSADAGEIEADGEIVPHVILQQRGEALARLGAKIHDSERGEASAPAMTEIARHGMATAA